MENCFGKSCLIDLYDCRFDLITSKEAIGNDVIQLCKLINMKRYLDTTIVHFGEDESVAGYSFTQLIETSLISGHFRNFYSSAYIDIFSCKDYDEHQAAKFTEDFFQAQHVIFKVNIRE